MPPIVLRTVPGLGSNQAPELADQSPARLPASQDANSRTQWRDPLASNIRAELAPAYQRLAQLKMGESTVLFTSKGGVYHLESLGPQGYRVTSGFPRAACAVRINGREVAGHSQLQPGDRVQIGAVTLQIPPSSGLVSAQEHKIWKTLTQLPVGGRLVLNSEILPSLQAGPIPCYIQKSGPGRFHLVSAASSPEILEVSSSSGWKRVPSGASVTIAAGTGLRLSGAFELTTPANDLPHRRRFQNSLWLCPDAPEVTIACLQVAGCSQKIAVGARTVELYGASKQQASVLAAAIAQEGLSTQVNELYLHPRLGKILRYDGSVSDIRVLSASERGDQVLISESGCEAVASARILLKDLNVRADLHGQIRKRFHQDPFTGRYSAQDRSYSVSAADAERHAAEQEGRSAIPPGSWMIDRKSPIDGGCVLRNPAQGQKILIYINGEADPWLRSCYDRFMQSRAERLQHVTAAEKDPEVRDILLLAQATEFVCQEALPYTNGADERVVSKLPKAATGSIAIVPFGWYIKERAGVCEHQALLAEYLAEQLRADGRISPWVKIHHERNHTPMLPPGWQRNGDGAHAWGRVQWPSGKIAVLDPAQKYVGRILTGASDFSSRWLYLRDEDIHLALEQPV